jgi:hypothetical protein
VHKKIVVFTDGTLLCIVGLGADPFDRFLDLHWDPFTHGHPDLEFLVAVLDLAGLFRISGFATSGSLDDG